MKNYIKVASWEVRRGNYIDRYSIEQDLDNPGFFYAKVNGNFPMIYSEKPNIIEVVENFFDIFGKGSNKEEYLKGVVYV